MRVKTDAKRRAILAAAAEVFREHGFAGASMTMVCERAGGSKATLYRYFASKDELFVTLMLEVVFEHANEVFETLKPSDNLRRTLETFGAGVLSLSLSEEMLAVRRNSIAEAARAGLGQVLFDRGAKVLWSRMADFLAGEMDAGRLRREDPWMVAMHLRGMLEADLVNRALVGAAVDRRRGHLKEVAAKAVDALLRAYGRTE
ncbi:MAG TPA: TetR/AcrR family transcriptional regulator [Caulobacteraceae bacterium]|jgi:AcrR family transcriptional regulator|nr:TetR/AcrR family transcriptional regulator [Caulobacteraceae bacterium]